MHWCSMLNYIIKSTFVRIIPLVIVIIRTLLVLGTDKHAYCTWLMLLCIHNHREWPTDKIHMHMIEYTCIFDSYTRVESIQCICVYTQLHTKTA